jgi:membrane protein
MRSFWSESSDELASLTERLWLSFLGRCVRRFLMMAGIDRCIVLSSQAFSALIPLLILVSTLAPTGKEDVVAQALISKFALSGEAAAAVDQLFATPVGVASSVSVFSAFLLLFSGVSFTRRMQTMYRTAWGQQKAGVRSGLFAALGLVALLVEVLVAYGIHGLVRKLPLEWLWVIPITTVTGLVLWTSIPYLLLNRQVHWHRLLVAGGTAAVAASLFGVATTVYMPELVTASVEDFGLFGITISLIGWLLAASFVIVASTAIGAEFDASRNPWTWRLKQRFRLYDPAHPVPEPDAAEPGGLSSGDLLVLVRLLVNWLITSAAVWAATALIPGIDVEGGLVTYLAISVLFGLVNVLLGPVLHLVALPLTVVTLGLFALVVNGVLLAVTAGLSDRLAVAGFGGTVIGALVIGSVTTLLELMIRPVTHADADADIG